MKARRALGWASIALIASLVLDIFAPTSARAAGGGEIAHSALLFLWIAIILIAAKIGCLVDRLGQPMVLGELLMGIAMGNLALIGIDWLEPIQSDEIIAFLAELGVVILLFQIGLESSVNTMLKVGARAFIVAVIGVVCPFALGTWIVGPWLLPGLTFNAYLFLGATLTATSVGITGRVFRDLGQLRLPSAQIVLGAAVIDDVLGLVILAVVSAIVSTGSLDAMGVSVILAKAIAFLVGALLIGRAIAPRISRIFARIHTGVGMKFTLVISTCLVFAFIAQLMDLAPIVGAFAAGLVLDEVQFSEFERPELETEVRTAVGSADPTVKAKVDQVLVHHGQKHIEHLIEPVGHFLVPFFFVVTGMQVKLDLLANVHAVAIAIALTAAAVLGKLVSGLAAGRGNGWLVGWGMVPRGEVGLIFAAVGKGLGVVSDEEFSIIVIMVILSTLMTPPILAALLKRKKQVAVDAGGEKSRPVQG
jgi:Kef-type K+ transport system membrane component KefB